MTNYQSECAINLIDAVSKAVQILDYLEDTNREENEGLSWILQDMSSELDTARSELEYAISGEAESPADHEETATA